MTKQLTKNRAIFHIAVIGIFHLISGYWEGCLAATEGQYFSGFHLLLNIYRQYLGILAGITLIIGIFLLCKFNFGRVLAIILAWWNLFTAPLFDIWWAIYTISIKKFLITDSWSGLWMDTAIVVIIMTLIRIYIIRMLNISRAGYVFLNKNKQNIHPRSGEKSGLGES